jgi:UDP-2-acetamido-3-amino-2,3-dideoxy-glucuronate N-acetyltransferase
MECEAQEFKEVRVSNPNPGVAVIGCGYWGKNLVRVFHELNALRLVCEVRQDTRRDVENNYRVSTSANLDHALADDRIQAVAIATPAVQHFELARRALEAGKDVYVEKPLALHSSEGRELVGLASAKSRILMVGHILEYHPAIVELKRLLREGELGRIQYLYSSRLNLGKLRTEENILWSFAPHDISVICSLLDEAPEQVASHGRSYLNPNILDTTLTTCNFRSGVQAHIFVSWLHPFKEQKLAIVGDRKMAVFDDVEPVHKLVLYSHRIDWFDRVPTAHKDQGQAVQFAKGEPLARECEHFLECVMTRKKPKTDGESGVRVLEVLEACERSIGNSGQSVVVAQARLKPNYYAHPTAVVDHPCEVGEDTKIWHFSHVMANCRIGKRCNIGQNVFIGSQVAIGNNVKIQNNVSIYTGIELEDDVFCGPSMVFTNIINPRSHIVRRNDYTRTVVRRGATLGANCTIVCGVEIGEDAFIAAGAVVTRTVPPHALMMGVPAKQVGWMCKCGVRLSKVSSEAECSSCKRRYRLEDGSCREVEPAEKVMKYQGVTYQG